MAGLFSKKASLARLCHIAAAVVPALLVALASCSWVYDLGPNGCDEQTPCRNPERPSCDHTRGLCQPALCSSHSSCPSKVCDLHGLRNEGGARCVPSQEVVLVGSSSALFDLLAKSDTLTRTILLAPGVYRPASGSWDLSGEGSTLIVGEGTRPLLTSAQGSLAPVVRIRGSAKVVLDGVRVSGGQGAEGHGLFCESPAANLYVDRVEVSENDGYAIWSRCPLTVGRSLIGGWQPSKYNRLGGLLAEASVVVQNSFFTYNGGPRSPIGGLAVQGPARLAFLTLAHNVAGGAGAALQCSSAPTEVWNTLIWDHDRPDAVSGRCHLRASAGDIPGLPASLTLGPGRPPGFRNASDFHLVPMSPLVDQGTDRGEIGFDFDGETRPSGVAVDIGADEVH